MEIQSAGENVGTRKPLEAEICAVGSAADRLDLGFDAGYLHSFHGLVNYMIMRLNLKSHVVILVLHICRGGTLTVFRVDEIHRLMDHQFPLLEFLGVMVADDVGEVGLLNAALI